jgi:hypothetical protein
MPPISGSDSLPYLSRLRARNGQTASLATLTRNGLELMDERRWLPLRTTEPGFADATAFHETRYRALRLALLALLEAEELRPLEDPL